MRISNLLSVSIASCFLATIAGVLFPVHKVKPLSKTVKRLTDLASLGMPVLLRGSYLAREYSLGVSKPLRNYKIVENGTVQTIEHTGKMLAIILRLIHPCFVKFKGANLPTIA